MQLEWLLFSIHYPLLRWKNPYISAQSASLCNLSNCLKVGVMQAAPEEIKIRVGLPTNGSLTSAKKRGLQKK